MMRKTVGVLVGLVSWFTLTAVAGIPLRILWPAYVTADANSSFTLAMLLTRLTIGVVVTLTSGLIAAWIAPTGKSTVILGVLLLLFFIPVHYQLWVSFPIWYHFTFLVSLIPVTMLGGWLLLRWRPDHSNLAGLK